MKLTVSLKEWARRVKCDVVAVYLAARDPRTPVHVRVLAVCVAAYALSPIDLIPDFIPVIGYLDDLVLVPLGIWLIVRALPPEVLSESRAKAAVLVERPASKSAAVFVVVLWVLCAVLFGYWLSGALGT